MDSNRILGRRQWPHVQTVDMLDFRQRLQFDHHVSCVDWTAFHQVPYGVLGHLAGGEYHNDREYQSANGIRDLRVWIQLDDDRGDQYSHTLQHVAENVSGGGANVYVLIRGVGMRRGRHAVAVRVAHAVQHSAHSSTNRNMLQNLQIN